AGGVPGAAPGRRTARPQPGAGTGRDRAAVRPAAARPTGARRGGRRDTRAARPVWQRVGRPLTRRRPISAASRPLRADNSTAMADGCTILAVRTERRNGSELVAD